jgi:hypothetical protein
MKKICNIIIVLMLMVSISSLALADEADDYTDDDLDGETPDQVNETEDEVETMTDSLGTEIRLLQLEKAILKNILKGEMSIEVLKGLGYNTTNLESIIAEMRLLLEEVQAADPNSTDAVEVFVDLKHDAINLTKDFREEVKELLSDVKYLELRQQIREMVCERYQNCSNLSKKIQHRIRQFNRNQIHRLYGIIGNTSSSLEEEYQNGNCTLEQVRSNISKMVNQMIKEKKKGIFLKLKTEKGYKEKQAEECMSNATVNFSEREQTRLHNRLQKTDDEFLRQRIQNRITNMNSNGHGPGSNVDDDTDGGYGPGSSDDTGDGYGSGSGSDSGSGKGGSS